MSNEPKETMYHNLKETIKVISYQIAKEIKLNRNFRAEKYNN